MSVKLEEPSSVISHPRTEARAWPASHPAGLATQRQPQEITFPRHLYDTLDDDHVVGAP
jgi:hypothetical protein